MNNFRNALETVKKCASNVKEITIAMKHRIEKYPLKLRIGICSAFVWGAITLIFMICLSSQQSVVLARLSAIESRVGSLENFYADLSTQLAVMKESLPNKQQMVFVISKDNFSTKALTLNEIYCKAKDLAHGTYSDAICKQAIKQSEEKGIPLHVLYTIIETESSFKYDAVSPSGESNGRGLMQVSDIALKEYNKYHKQQFVKSDLYDIRYNLEVGCWYYKFIYDKYNKGNPDMTWKDLYCAYNVGYTDYKKNKDSYYSGWDPTRKQKYNALNHWDSNFLKYENQFFG